MMERDVLALRPSRPLDRRCRHRPCRGRRHAARRRSRGRRYAVIVQGASGEPAVRHAPSRLGRRRSSRSCATGSSSTPPHLTVLVEQPEAGEERVDRRERARPFWRRLAKQLKADDLLFVMLIGHGGGDGADAKFNLVGPDLTIAEWSALLEADPGRIAFVDTTSSSFPFLEGLAAPEPRRDHGHEHATRSGITRCFPTRSSRRCGAEAADADKNGRISLLEAFTHASRLVGAALRAGRAPWRPSAPCSTTPATATAVTPTATGADGAIAGAHVSRRARDAEGRRSRSAEAPASPAAR